MLDSLTIKELNRLNQERMLIQRFKPKTPKKTINIDTLRLREYRTGLKQVSTDKRVIPYQDINQNAKYNN